MEIVLHVSADFDAVYLINGAFFDNVAAVRYTDADLMYLTVLPLRAHLMSYTVKMRAGHALTNSELTEIYELPSSHFTVKLLSRYNYVYSPAKPHPPSVVTSPAAMLVQSLKRGDVTAARKLLTPSLSASIDDAALTEFFGGVKDVIENRGYLDYPPSCYFLIDEDGRGTPYRFGMRDMLIDDIEEL